MTTGRILCRFVNHSDDLKALESFLRRFVSGDFASYFIVQEQGYLSEEITVLLSEDIINMMCVRGTFKRGVIEFRVHKELSLIHISPCPQDNSSFGSSGRYFPISGFPRELVVECKQPGTCSYFIKPLQNESPATQTYTQNNRLSRRGTLCISFANFFY